MSNTESTEDATVSDEDWGDGYDQGVIEVLEAVKGLDRPLYLTLLADYPEWALVMRGR